MKTIKNSILLLATTFGILAAMSARAVQDSTTDWFSLTNLPSVIRGGATSNLFTAGTVPTDNVFSVRQNRGASMFMKFHGTNAATTGVMTAKLALTPDGTNYTTTGPISGTATANGTNGVMEFTNFPPAVFNNAKKFTLQSLANGDQTTNSFLLDGVWFSFGK